MDKDSNRYSENELKSWIDVNSDAVLHLLTSLIEKTYG